MTFGGLVQGQKLWLHDITEAGIAAVHEGTLVELTDTRIERLATTPNDRAFGVYQYIKFR